MGNSLQEYLQEVNGQTSEDLMNNGFAYMHIVCFPRLLEAGKVQTIDRKLLAEGWFKAAGVYQIIGCPKRAIQLIKKALAANPEMSRSYHLMASVQNSMGQNFEALGSVEKALDLAPDLFELQTLKQKIQDDMNYSVDPDYVPDDAIWTMNELLANEQFETVINRVLDGEMNQPEELKCLARAFGAVSHHGNYLKIWTRIFSLDSDVTANNADWFYLPVDLRENEYLKGAFINYL